MINYELKGLKSELAAIDRKIQLKLAKENQPKEGELQKQVANSDVVKKSPKAKGTLCKGLRH
ncbi:hypothetical protein [Xylanibacter ruminicola]|uniref:hypothetical protein n=1 Tax=Xylanibacter ruminicola TaxID=839 RepID=UPI00093268D3|nr:hypothetical protein [Xylanibacter ruminicola]